MVKTAKGYHYWFRGNGVGRHPRALPAVDVCGRGGYVIAPPSVHPSGATYTWVREPAGPLPPLPQVVLDAIERSKRASFAHRDPEPVGQPIGQGERNNHLASLAGSMRHRGMTAEEIEAALLVTNTTRCDPPLPDAEVRQIAWSIGRYLVTPPDQPGAPPDEAPPTRNGRGYPPPRAWIDIDLMAHQFPPLKEVVPGLVVEGATLLVGKPKGGKSTLALDLLMAVTSSGQALGTIDVDQGDALYISLEGAGRHLQKRLARIGHQATGRLTIWESCPPFAQGGLDAISGWLDEHPAARLVVIDTLQRMRGGETGTSWVYASDYDVMGKVRDLAERHGVAILVLHHSRKADSDDDFIDVVSGSNGLAGVADTIVVMKRLRGQADAVLHVTGRDVDEQEYPLRGDPETLRWELLPGSALEHMLRDTRAAVLAYVRDHPRTPPKRIAEGTGLDYSLVKKTCARMARDGQLVKDLDGRYALDDLTLRSPDPADAGGTGTAGTGMTPPTEPLPPPETPVTPVPSVPNAARERDELDDWYHLAELQSMDWTS